MATRILSQADVTSLLDMGECIELMASTLAALARGEAVAPLRSVTMLPGGRSAFAMMPAYLGGDRSLGAKVITFVNDNHGTEHDSHQGAVLVFEPRHGSLVAIVDATAITTIRTAAVSAVATRLLAREDASVLAILGAGVQARAHVDAIAKVRPIRELRVWSRSTAHARSLASHAAERYGLEAKACSTAAAAVEGASIVCTATSATEPVLEGTWLSPGTHVNAVGACVPSAREIDTATVVRSRLYVDRRDSALHEPGDILVPLKEGAMTPDHIVGEMGELLIGKAPGRTHDDEITLFKSLGLAVEDLASAEHVYRCACDRQVGTELDLGGRRDVLA